MSDDRLLAALNAAERRELDALAELDEVRADLAEARKALAERDAENTLQVKLRGEALFQAELEAKRATDAEGERDTLHEHVRVLRETLVSAPCDCRFYPDGGEDGKHHYKCYKVEAAEALSATEPK